MAQAHLLQGTALDAALAHHAGLGGDEGIWARFRVTVLKTSRFDMSNGKDLMVRILNPIISASDATTLVPQ